MSRVRKPDESHRRRARSRAALASAVVATLAALTACASRAPSPAAGTTVSAADTIGVRAGRLTGATTAKAGVRAYLGVPFAAPPVGDGRWRAPRALASWSGVRAADRFSPSCMQAAPAAFGPWTLEFLLRGPVSEDCLYLNVWTAAARGERRPVLVYIYGGGFSSGSGDVPVYDGAALASRGLVVITINYRVGVLGFLAHPELSAESGDRSSGNYGLLDQVAALQWVRDNVEAFGGDPTRVTIAGQSAGAISVFLLTASPMAKGLFHRASIQSGPGGLAAFGIGSTRAVARPLADAEKDGIAFAESKGAKSIAELRAIPAAELIKPSPGSAGMRFGPIVDGRFLREDPAATFAAGRQNDVATITGLNADEGSASPAYGKQSADAFRKSVTGRYGDRAPKMLAAYPAGTDEEARRAQVESARDAGIAGVFAMLAERAKTARTPAYMYFFDRAIPWPERPEFGAFHTAEVPYVFGTLDALPRPWTDVDRRLSDAMMTYWVSFATRGDPNGSGAAPWPAFQPGRLEIMELGERIGPRPIARERLELFTP